MERHWAGKQSMKNCVKQIRDEIASFGLFETFSEEETHTQMYLFVFTQ